MKKKANLSSFGKFVLYSVISAIIFLTIYSIWFEPTMTGQVTYSFPERIKEFAGDIGDKIKSITPTDSKEELSGFSCKSSLDEFIKTEKIKKGNSYKIKLQETKEFSNRLDLEEYFKKWGGESSYDVEVSIEKLNDINFPVNVALIKKEVCNNYGCDVWFNWGICKEESNQDFERMHSLGWL